MKTENNVYLFIVIHGLLGFLPFISRGTRTLDRMIDELKRFRCHDFLQVEFDRMIDFMTDWVHENPGGEVVFVTHSMGVYRGIEAAHYLNELGVKVRYFAAIDPTAINRLFKMIPMHVPENVLCVDEFHADSGAPQRARHLAPDGSRGGKLIYPLNTDMRVQRRKFDVGHIPLASDKRVIRRVMNKIEELP